MIKARFSDFSYTNSRISAKRAKLLEKRDYDNLLKMEANEIARNLEEGDYSREINELGSRYDGPELVELALNKNLSRTLTHLLEFSPKELQTVLETYLRRYDTESLKRLLRWKKSDQDIVIQDLMISAGSLERDMIEELAELDFGEIVSEIEFPNSNVSYSEYLEGKEELTEIEHALDCAYFEELRILASKIGSSHFRKFVDREIRHENLRTVLRLKKYGFEKDEIKDYLFFTNGFIQEVAETEDFEAAVEKVKDREGVQADSLERLEHVLQVKRLEDAIRMTRIEPLGITPIIGYVIAKIIEVKNLRILIRAKESGIENRDEIRKDMVIA